MKALTALAVSSLMLTSVVAAAAPLCAPGKAAGIKSSLDQSKGIGVPHSVSGYYAMATPFENGVDPDVRIRLQLHRDRISN